MTILDSFRLNGRTALITGSSGGIGLALARALGQAGAQVIPCPQTGYGAALQQGFSKAACEYIVTMDADLSHPPDFLRQMWQSRHTADVDELVRTQVPLPDALPVLPLRETGTYPDQLTPLAVGQVRSI